MCAKVSTIIIIIIIKRKEMPGGPRRPDKDIYVHCVCLLASNVTRGGVVILLQHFIRRLRLDGSCKETLRTFIKVKSQNNVRAKGREMLAWLLYRNVWVMMRGGWFFL